MPDHRIVLDVTANSRESAVALIASWALISAGGKNPMDAKNVKGSTKLVVDDPITP